MCKYSEKKEKERERERDTESKLFSLSNFRFISKEPLCCNQHHVNSNAFFLQCMRKCEWFGSGGHTDSPKRMPLLATIPLLVLHGMILFSAAHLMHCLKYVHEDSQTGTPNTNFESGWHECGSPSSTVWNPRSWFKRVFAHVCKCNDHLCHRHWYFLFLFVFLCVPTHRRASHWIAVDVCEATD